MTDLLQIIQTLVGYLPNLELLAQIISWIMGLFFVFQSIRMAGSRSEAGRSEGAWTKPATTFFIGVAFIALPAILGALTRTFFQQETPDPSSIFEYAPSTIGLLETGSPARTIVTGITSVIMFIGIIAVMRGLYLLNRSAQGAGGPPTFGPGLTFLIAGIFAVNFPLFVAAMERLVTATTG